VFAPVFAERSEVFAPVAVDVAPAAPALVSEANTGEQAEANTEQPEAEQQEETEQAEASPAPARLTTEQAREVVEQCWANGLGVRETARRATRSPSTVTGMFARLEKERGPQPSAGQLALVK
jgi:DNA-binding NarL/FixJ family response regulator